MFRKKLLILLFASGQKCCAAVTGVNVRKSQQDVRQQLRHADITGGRSFRTHLFVFVTTNVSVIERFNTDISPKFGERSAPQELEKRLKLTLPWASTRTPIVSTSFPHAGLSILLYTPCLAHYLPQKRQNGVFALLDFPQQDAATDDEVLIVDVVRHDTKLQRPGSYGLQRIADSAVKIDMIFKESGDIRADGLTSPEGSLQTSIHGKLVFFLSKSDTYLSSVAFLPQRCKHYAELQHPT